MARIMRGLIAATLAVGLACGLGPVATAGEWPSSARTQGSPWTLVVNDRFNGGGVPAHWTKYDGPYGSGAHNCAAPGHAFVRNGLLRMVMRYESSGECGAGWYSAGLRLVSRFDSVDQKISVRFRVASIGGVQAHRIIPMRWPASTNVADPGEEDYCEGSRLAGCTTFLHHGDTQQYHKYAADLTTWHRLTFVRRDFTVRAWVDGVLRWTYRGTPTTLPATPKHPVLQQECQHDGCPVGSSGGEVILIDWVRVWNPTAQ